MPGTYPPRPVPSLPLNAQEPVLLPLAQRQPGGTVIRQRHGDYRAATGMARAELQTPEAQSLYHPAHD